MIHWPVDESQFRTAVTELKSGALTVPLAILLGHSTYSAAEDFLAFMRALPQVIYVGSRSAGSTGQRTPPTTSVAW